MMQTFNSTDCPPEEAFNAARQILAQGGASQTAITLLQQAVAQDATNQKYSNALASLLFKEQDFLGACTVLENLLQKNKDAPNVWLLLGEIREATQQPGAVAAFYQAITRAQFSGHWLSESTTPPMLLNRVIHAINRLRSGRRELFLGSYDAVRIAQGPSAVKRLDTAVLSYLKEIEILPPNPSQKPRFFYFPGLPPGPYHDPFLQPWAKTLADSFEDIRREAISMSADRDNFRGFIDFKPGDNPDKFLSGNTQKSWDAFFFYRHGQRFDGNHVLSPKTSKILESIELCRIDRQAPEICFSLLTAGTTILPHYGVTNTRLVMHLPLVVPNDCALNVINEGEHHWREGELMLFDDTYQHEAWNRSNKDRLILLMDCWNPHLTEAEKEGSRLFIETVNGLRLAGQKSY